MVINTNSQAASNLNINAPGPKPASRAQTVEAVPPEDDLSITTRNPLATPEIENEEAAVEVARYAKSHILDFPAVSVGVQANARPEVVFELLQGLLA